MIFYLVRIVTFLSEKSDFLIKKIIDYLGIDFFGETFGKIILLLLALLILLAGLKIFSFILKILFFILGMGTIILILIGLF